MKHIIALSAAAFIVLAGQALAGGFVCHNGGIHCVCPPPPDCPDCGCPCNDGHHHCSPRKFERACQFAHELACGNCCERIEAARKLGHRWNGDFCCDPQVLDALTRALLCDPCWEVRRAAAWSIAMQGARVESGVLALYVSSKIDPHYLVRDRAAEALDILLVCRRPCFKELFAAGDELSKTLKADKYRPGQSDCIALFQHCLAGCGSRIEAVSAATLPPVSDGKMVK